MEGVAVVSREIIESFGTLDSVTRLLGHFGGCLVVRNDFWLEHLLKCILFLLFLHLFHLLLFGLVVLSVIIKSSQCFTLARLGDFSSKGWVHLSIYQLLLIINLLLCHFCHFLLRGLLFLHEFFVFVAEVVRCQAFLLFRNLIHFLLFTFN